MRSLVLLALLSLLLPAELRAEERTHVAVLPFETGHEDAGLGQAAADLVAASLALSPELVLLEREHVDAVLAERALAGAGVDVAAIGGLLAVDVLVVGAVGTDEAQWRLTVQALRVPAGEVLAAVTVSEERAELARAVQKAVEQLRASLGAKPTGTRFTSDGKARASLHVLRGLGYERAGLRVEAIGQFLEARRLAATLPEASFWMGRAYAGAGQPEHAVVALRSFLAAVGDAHPLRAEARSLLDASARAVAAHSPPEPPRLSLSEFLLSDASADERRAAVEAAIARGPAGAAELAAAIELPYENALANRLLLGLADVDAERFHRAVLENPDLLYTWPGDVRRRFKETFTPGVARRVATSIASAHEVERRSVTRLYAYLVNLRLPEEILQPFRDVIEQAGASEDETISLTALRLDPTRPDNAALIGKRLVNERFSAKYRAELIALSTDLVASHPAVFEALLAMLGDENEEIRRAAGLHLGWGLRKGTSETWEAVKEARARVARRAGKLIASRRYPADAEWLVQAGEGNALVPNVDIVTPDLLASEHPRERSAGLELLRRARSPEAFPAAKALLGDPDHGTVQLAIAVVGELGDVAEAEQVLFDFWRAEEAAEGEEAERYRLWFESSLHFACQALARRMHPGTKERPPNRAAGSQAYAAYLDRVRASKDGVGSGVQRR